MSEPKKTKKSTTRDMTQGTIWKQLVVFSAPILLGNIFQQFYSTIDSVVVGNYVGANALGAVTSNMPAINTLIGVFIGFSTGASVVISRHFGAKDEARIRKSIHTSVVVSVIMGILLALVGLAISPALVKFMRTPDEIAPGAILYLRIFFAGVIGLCVYNIGSAILRAVGDSRRPLYFLIFSSVVNIVLDILFVVKFKLGVAGVAYATVLSEFISSILVLYVLFKSKDVYNLRLSEMKIDRPILKQIVTIGIPGAVQMAVTAFSNLFVQGYVNSFGAASTAGWGAYQRIDAFAMMPAMSLGLASTTFTGQNVGAGKYDRVRKGLRTSMLLGIGVTVLISITLFTFAPQAIGIFNKESDVLYFGTLYLRMITPFAFLICFTQMFSGVLRGVGDATAPMVIMLSSFVAFRQIYLFVATRITDSIYPVSVAFPVGWFVCTILLVIHYRRTMRKFPKESVAPKTV